MGIRTRILTSIGVLALVASTAVPAIADEPVAVGNQADVDVKVLDPAGAVTAVIYEDSAQPFNDVTYSFSAAQVSSGTLILEVLDNRGTALGWTVTIKGTSFAKADTSVGGPIAINNLKLTPGLPVKLEGTGSIPLDTSSINAVSGTPQEIWEAAANQGDGKFRLPVPGQLTVPAGTLVDTYTSTITVEIPSGPGDD